MNRNVQVPRHARAIEATTGAPFDLIVTDLFGACRWLRRTDRLTSANLRDEAVHIERLWRERIEAHGDKVLVRLSEGQHYAPGIPDDLARRMNQ